MKRKPSRRLVALRPEELETRRLLSTLVAIVDTGVNVNDSYSSPYYDMTRAKNMATGLTGAQNVQDMHGHGSNVTTLAVQAIREFQNQVGGSNADVKIIPVKVRDDSAGHSYDFLVASGIRYAADQDAAVINVSLVFEQHSLSLTRAIQYAESLGSIVVTGAGNDGANMDDPAFTKRYFPALNDDPVIVPVSTPITNIIVAAAVNSSGDLTPVSNWGPIHVDVGAPTGTGGETSYAAGYLSGFTGAVASLMPAGHTFTQVLNIVKGTVTPHARPGGAWSTTGGNVSPANAVQALNPLPTTPTALSLGQDGHDFIGEGASSSGPDGYQDIHIALFNLSTSKTIAYIDVIGSGGGQWRYAGTYGHYKAALANYSPGSATADLYVPPYQNEIGRTFAVVIHYTDSTSSTATTNGVYATYHLSMAPPVPTAISLGQDGYDAIGPGSGSTGPDGYQDIHFSLSNLATSKTIDWIRVLDNNGGEWRFGNSNGSWKAVLANYSAGSATADVYIPTYVSEAGRSFTLNIFYTDSTSVAVSTNGVYATHNLPMTSAGLSATALGQDGQDFIGEGAASSGPDGYQDIHIVLSGLPTTKTISWIGITGQGGGEWRYNGAYGTFKAALVNYTAGSKTADLYVPPYMTETGRSYFLTIYFTDSTFMTVTAFGVYAIHQMPA